MKFMGDVPAPHILRLLADAASQEHSGASPGLNVADGRAWWTHGAGGGGGLVAGQNSSELGWHGALAKVMSLMLLLKTLGLSAHLTLLPLLQQRVLETDIEDMLEVLKLPTQGAAEQSDKKTAEPNSQDPSSAAYLIYKFLGPFLSASA